MKRAFTTGFLLVIIAVVFWPDYEKLTYSYQDYMFTSLPADDAFEIMRGLHRIDITLRLGPMIEGELMPWHRVRLGFPFQAITSDTQIGHGIFQLRWEGYPFLGNLALGSALGFMAGCIMAVLKWNCKIQEKRGEQTGAANPGFTLSSSDEPSR